MRTRPTPRSSPGCPAPTTRRCCSPSAAIATRCNGRCRRDAPRKTGSGSSRRWPAAPPSRETPGTYAFGQKQFIEPLADYLTSIRGPDSETVPFTPRPRPTDAASTNIVVTEYALPRGGERELFMLRGDRRFVWPHDVIMNDKYAYYTDHFSYVLGRIDVKTGEGEGAAVPGAEGRRPRRPRMMGDGDTRPGAPGGGAHELQFDRQGNVIVGMDNGTVKYDPETGKFTAWSAGRAMFGLDPDGNVWNLQRNGDLTKIDTSSEELKKTTFQLPKNRGIYDTDTDSKGRTDIYIWTEGKIGIFDPATVKYSEYLTPTPMAGPRRGQIDGKDRLWAGEFYAGQLLMFDPDKKVLQGISADQRRQALHGALCRALFGERRRQAPDRVDARFQQQPALPHRHEHRALDGIHDAVELRGARSQGRHRGRAPDRVGAGLSAAGEAGEDPGAVNLRASTWMPGASGPAPSPRARGEGRGEGAVSQV